ncbi:MAG: hypothetical protein AAF938_12750 [Myxococcota bacterium]
MSDQPIQDEPDLSRVLESLREVPEAAPEMRARVKAHVEAVGQVAGAASAAAGGAALTSAGLVGTVLGLSVGVAVGWGMGVASESGTQVSEPAVQVVDAASVLDAGFIDASVDVLALEMVSPLEEVVPSVEVGTMESTRRSDTRRLASPMSRERRGSLAAERRLIDVAFAALREGNEREAQRALERHAERFPNGALAAEREVLRARLHAPQ